MNEPRMQVIREMTARVHTLKQAQAAELAGAARHREHGDYTRAAIAEHAAQVNASMAVIYQEVAGILSGTWLPEAADVTEPGEGLGVRVGIIAWAPPQGATPAQLHRWREFCDELQQSAIRQKYLTDDAIPGAHATQATGQLAPEDMPQPDPLTAPPTPGGGAGAVQGGASPRRPWTPDRSEVGEDGRRYTVVTMKRACNGCGQPIGDVTSEELDAGGAGGPLPDVRGECPTCSGGQAPAPAIPNPETARHGIRRIARGGKRAKHAPSKKAAPSDAPSPYASFEGRTPDGAVAAEPAWEPRAYPDKPANGGGPVEQERSDDPSALMVDGEITQAFPAPVTEDGGDRG